MTTVSIERVSWVEKVKNSVLKINAVDRTYNWAEPYKLGDDVGVCGSGFFVDQIDLFGKQKFPGYRILLTNSHVVEGAPTKKIRLMYPGTGKSYLEATVAYLCESIDFAILLVNPNDQNHWFEMDISAKQFLTSRENLKFETISMRGNGEECIAVGYPHDSEDSVATVGCIACRSENMFQLAMSINDGNSGGAICYNGKVIGIATSTLSEAEGIAFGVPVKQVAEFVQNWIGDLKPGSLLFPPSLGVETRPGTAAFFKSIDSGIVKSGAIVMSIQPNSTFHKAGLKEGDVLTGISTYHARKLFHFQVDCHGLLRVPWSLAKVELDNLDFVLFCDRKKTRIHFLSKQNSKKRNRLPKYRSIVKSCPIFITRKNVPTLVPYWDTIEHILFGGMCLMNLCKNHANRLREEQIHKTDPRFLFKLLETNGDEEMLCVSHVYPQSIVSDTETLSDLAIISSINGKSVKNINEARPLLQKAVDNVLQNAFVHFSSDKHDDIVLDLRELIAQEHMFIKSIPHHPTNTLLNVPVPKRSRKKI